MNTSESRVNPVAPFWRRIVDFGLDVVFPPVCAACRRVGWLLCPDCRTSLVAVAGPICSRCGRSNPAGPICNECAVAAGPVGQTRAPMRYEEPLSDVIHRFKYEGYSALGEPLGGILIDGWPDWGRPPDLILPIPLHPRRQRSRGYNQSELLARPLARVLGIPTDAALLQRVRHTVPQVGLGPHERRDNVRGAFAAGDGVAGRQVLLVDDVLTTGATMAAAAEALLQAGAAGVDAYCLARVS